jgi:hypothetical protein
MSRSDGDESAALIDVEKDLLVLPYSSGTTGKEDILTFKNIFCCMISFKHVDGGFLRLFTGIGHPNLKYKRVFPNSSVSKKAKRSVRIFEPKWP